MDLFSLMFLVAAATFLIGVFVGSMNSREHYEQKAKENERFWLEKRDEWLSFFHQQPQNKSDVVYVGDDDRHVAANAANMVH